MRRIAALCALLLGLWADQAAARAYSVEDLLATEEVGRVVFDPTGRRLIIEHRRPWKSAARFDYNYFTPLLLTELLSVKVDRPGPARPLFPQDPAAGYMAGPIAPDGRRMLVYRLQDRSFEAGLVTFATGEVRWLGVTPEFPVHGPTAQWRSDDEVILIARPDGDLTWRLGVGWEAQDRLTELWARTAGGQTASASAIGSGRFLGIRPKGEAPRVLKIDAHTGAAHLLAQGEFVDLAVSPSGRYAALIANGEDLQPRADEAVYAAFPTRRRSLTLIDLQAGDVTTPCASCEIALGLLAWSPTQDSLLAATLGEGADRRRLDLVRIEAATGAVSRPLPDNLKLALAMTSEGAPLARADWFAADPLVYAAGPKGRPDWYRLSNSGVVNLTAGLDLAPRQLGAISTDHILLAADGAAWAIGPNGERTVVGEDLASSPLAPAQEPGSRLVANPRLPADGMATARGQEITVLSATRRGRRFTLPDQSGPMAITRDHAVAMIKGPGGVRRLSMATSKSAWVPLLEINRPLADVEPARTLPVRHRGPTSADLTSWLYLPVSAPPTRGYPLVVIPYRGRSYPAASPSYEVGAFSPQVNPQILAAAGYAVLTPSLPYDQAGGEPVRGAAAQILDVVDAAIAEQSLDPDRIALWGHSFGALTAVAAATQTPRFKSVIASAGAHNEISHWGSFRRHQWVFPQDGTSSTSGAGLVEAGQAHMMAPPWADPQRYLRNSNLFAADRINVPVLLIHGEADELLIDQSQQLFSALNRQGKDAVFVTYWGEGHALASPANLRDLYGRIIAWLGETLPPGPGAAAARPSQ